MSIQAYHSKRTKISAFNIVNLTFISILTIIMIYPFYNILIVSVANYNTLISTPVYMLPYSFQLHNYTAILSEASFYRGILVTVFITVVGTALSMLVSICCAYALSNKELPGRNIFISLILFTMFFGGGLIPFYLIISSLGLANTVWVMIIPAAVSSFYVFVMKSYFLTLPASLGESAKMDGANDLQILAQIIIPISKPIIATFSLFYAVDRWNEWWYALLFINDPKIRPLQIVLREILISLSQMISERAKMYMEQNNTDIFSTGMQAAAIVCTMAPILLCYPFLQKYFVKGIMIGSIKE